MSTWILLRGLSRERRHWGGFPECLARELAGARVVMLDLPGNGDLNGLESPWTIAEMAQHCRAELKRLGGSPPYHLLAMSLGAMVATAWAQGHPEEIEACVLINTSFGFFSPLNHRLRPRAWLGLARLLFTRDPRGRERIIFRLTSCLVPASDGLIEAWTAIRLSHPVGTGNIWRQMIAAARFRTPERAPVPTFVLAGGGDRLVDTRCSTEIASRWRCPIAIHPEAGHDLPLDDGEWVARQVREWLAR